MASYDRHLAAGSTAAGIHPCIDQSIADLWPGHGLDRIDHRLFFAKSAGANHDINNRARLRCLGLASIKKRKTRQKSGKNNGKQGRTSRAGEEQKKRK